MIKEIKYNGCTANPSDYECADGDLTTAIGFVPEDGTMKPVLPPSLVLQIEGMKKLFHIHKTASFTQYIYLRLNSETNKNELWYYNPETKETKKILDLKTLNIVSVTSIGNTLVLVCTETPYYLLWNGQGYTNLGRHLPEINLSFGLQGHPRLFSKTDSSKSQFTISFDEMSISNMLGEFPDTQKNQITEQIMAKVNKFLAEQSLNKGRFALPFFVRYGLRLYDGSVVMHSAPILMNPCTTNNPIVYWTEGRGEDTATGVTNATCDMMLLACDLDYAYNDITSSSDLDDWTDIVKSVDIFISKPIYPYDQNGKISSCRESDDFDSVFVGRLKSNGQSLDIEEDKVIAPVTGAELLDSSYTEWLYSHIYTLYFSLQRTTPWGIFRLPEYTDEKNAKGIKNCSSFYLLHSIKLSELNTERKVIPVEEDYLQSLVAREVMADDYQTHDKIIPKYAFNYNNRINFANIDRELFKGFPMSSMVSFCNTRMNFELGGSSIGLQEIVLSRPQINSQHLTDRYSVIVYIKENGEEKQVCCDGYRDTVLCNFLTDEGNSSDRGESWGCYFYYPNANAYKMKIVPLGLNAATQWGKSYDIDLAPHDFLNGAYALLNYNLKRNSSGAYGGETNDQTSVVSHPNKIYTSEVNNPFFFPVLGINTVGAGDILGISTAAKALSQGQFGQFPLYAFTSEGVWALEVSNTGTYSAKQPVTRDVVINPESITQIDSAVLFATDRGIMHISGSTVQCISDRLNTEEMFRIADLPKFDQLINIFNGKADESEQITLAEITLLPFNEFLPGCRMVYDYANQHLIVYNPAVRYAYVYSLKSQSWGMMRSDIVDNVNSHPEALAMADGAKLVDFSKPVAENITALIITRPFKIDDPNTFKTINTIIQRGMFRSTHVQQVLYGSNDLIHWHPVCSSVDKIMRGFRGTPYKAFRLALICKFDKGERLYGFTVAYEPRMTNQVR